MPYPDKSDEELIRLYRESGDKDLVVTLFQRIEHHLAAMTLDLLKNREDSEDILSTVLMELFDDLMRREVRDFGAFTYVKAKNECLSFLKKRGRTELVENYGQKYEGKLVEKVDFGSLGDRQKEIVNQVLWECIQGLPVTPKKCLELFFFYDRGNGKLGMRYQEIEKKLGLTNREVTTALQKARRRMKKCLESRNIRGVNIFFDEE